MEVYTEETLGKKKAKIIVIMDHKEAQTIQMMCDAAVASNRKKSTWKRIRKFFNERMDCWYSSSIKGATK